MKEWDGNDEPMTTYTRGIDLSGTLEGLPHEREPYLCSFTVEAEPSEIQSTASARSLTGERGIGGLLARTTYGQEILGAPTAAFYHADGNGNITALMYPDQQLAAKYLYDPFGNMLAMSGPLRNFNKYRFSSKEWNDNTGLYYFGYRFYDPSLQRWPNRDPFLEGGFDFLRERLPRLFYRIGASGERFEGPNLYVFVKNSPIYKFDDSGLQDACLAWPWYPADYPCKWDCRVLAATLAIACAGIPNPYGQAACASAIYLAEQACEEACDRSR